MIFSQHNKDVKISSHCIFTLAIHCLEDKDIFSFFITSIIHCHAVTFKVYNNLRGFIIVTQSDNKRTLLQYVAEKDGVLY